MNKKFLNFDTEDCISKYFKEVKKTSIITPEKELELSIKIKNGDQKALEQLVKSNLKFVISVAKEYQNQGLSLPDLINEGNYGLIKAASRFDHTKGFRFISYAVWWVRQSILQSLNDNARIVRLPANIINKITKINKELSKFENKHEREPVFGEMINGVDYASSSISFPRATSLNQSINEDGDELISLLASEQEDGDEIETADKVKDELNRILSILDERERDIIECYFGINMGTESMTLEKIGEEHNLTKERIRQIKEKAIRKLRHNAQDLQALLKQ